ncbi:hypothetical protein [Streptomyces sp. ISL-94]|uniref:hypothetical protein n=1 Tax=Streptomyces sp. ISL-94 TaxID=2819190 RepID=UPI001BE9F6D6|nr:hypothetical protein [Streptomyces sp. ISL-94]MBT2480903.1 hypothetical protein [Streptomyces sp. ISL-94]
MADERDRWLDGAAAERLLRGEPVEPVGPAADPRARREAARLRAALDSLDALGAPAPAGAELPGEAAALAAFRAARGTAGPAAAGSPAAGSGASDAPTAPLVDLGRTGIGIGIGIGGRGRGSGSGTLSGPRRGRPVRFGLAAALASIAVGGLAAAAGAGLLDQPRRTTAGPGPAMSVSADGIPTQGADGGSPTLSPQLRPTPLPDGPGQSATGGTVPPSGGTGERTTTDGGTGAGSGVSPGAGATGGSGKDVQGGKDGDRQAFGSGGETGTALTDRDRDRENHRRAVDLCNDYRAGHLNDDRRRRLSALAGGLARIPYYCEALLDGVTDSSRSADGPGDSVLKAPTLAPALSGTPKTGR